MLGVSRGVPGRRRTSGEGGGLSHRGARHVERLKPVEGQYYGRQVRRRGNSLDRIGRRIVAGELMSGAEHDERLKDEDSQPSVVRRSGIAYYMRALEKRVCGWK
jgi:hypothetical protein